MMRFFVSCLFVFALIDCGSNGAQESDSYDPQPNATVAEKTQTGTSSPRDETASIGRGKTSTPATTSPEQVNNTVVSESGTQRELLRLTGHGKAVFSVDVSRDGRLILSSGSDNSLRLWDTKTDKVIRQFVGHRQDIGTVAFSPDGRRAVSGSWDHGMRLWDVGSGDMLREYCAHLWPVLTVAFSSDGTHALSETDGFRF